jgi:NADPH:quinone reductase-like Zn-dependent oxidoreductase
LAACEPHVRRDVDELAKRNIRAHNLLSHPVKQDFEELARLASTAELQIPIELTLPLAKANEALELSQSGMARGKIVLTIT